MVAVNDEEGLVKALDPRLIITILYLLYVYTLPIIVDRLVDHLWMLLSDEFIVLIPRTWARGGGIMVRA